MSPFFKKQPVPTPQPQPTKTTVSPLIQKIVNETLHPELKVEEEEDEIEVAPKEETELEVSNAVVSDGIRFCYKNVAGEVFDFHVGGLTVQHALNALDFCLDRALFLRNYKQKDKTDVNPLT